MSLTLAVAIAAPAAVHAQSLGPDEKELAAYRLTMPTVRKAAAAMRAFAELSAKDPKMQEAAKLEAQIEALASKEELTAAEEATLEKLRARQEKLEEEGAAGPDMGNAETISGMEAEIKRLPGANAILAREGITAREFSKTFLALLQASLVVGFSQGKVDMAKLPPGVNPENIKFVQTNEKELQALQAEMAALNKKQ